MHLKININFLEKYLANFVNDIEYKRITKKLKEYVSIEKNIDNKGFFYLQRMLRNVFLSTPYK